VTSGGEVDPSASVHPSVVCDPGASIGPRTRVWHFVHVASGASIGADCVVGQGCYIAPTARVGDRSRLQNNVSVYDGVTLEEDVFCGPSVVFTNAAARVRVAAARIRLDARPQGSLARGECHHRLRHDDRALRARRGGRGGDSRRA